MAFDRIITNLPYSRKENIIEKTCKSRILDQIPNILTILRIIIVPPFILFLFGKGVYSGIIALSLFIIASLSDYFDGFIARKYDLKSSFGEFLDPLADKILVGSAFISFTLMPDFYIPIWLVAVILFREILVTILRIIAINRGKPVKTKFSGKIKTAFQMFTIISIILLIIIKRYILSLKPFLETKGREGFWISLAGNTGGSIIYYIPFALVSISAGLALFSLIKYIFAFRESIK